MNLINPLNPLVAAQNKYQHLSWKHLKNNETYHFEFLQPLKGPVTKHNSAKKQMGTYWTIIADAIDKCKTNILPMQAQERVLIDIPVKTFERAWVAISLLFRRDFTPKHNLRIKFVKKSKQSMFIQEIEKLMSTPEQDQFCNEKYQEVILSQPTPINEKDVLVRRRQEY